nr:MAG TPA: Protein of unknown function (DUF2800) [Caudoviricetes sp.]
MNFNKHSNLVGQHAFLGASKYHWLNYDASKIAEAFRAAQAVQMGTRLHAYAAESIDIRQKLPKSHKTLNMYVNDAIGFNLKPEQVLYYSPNCFGTADTIDLRGNTLRIHDLKTGKIPAHMEQLMIYAALFCLEYDIKPHDIEMLLRIYQNDDVQELKPEANDISAIAKKIIEADKIVNELRETEG